MNGLLRDPRGVQRALTLAIVLHVRDLAVAHRHELKEERVTAPTGIVDPVDAYDGCAGAYLHELVGAEPPITRPFCLLLFPPREDRPGLLRPLSAWRFAPP